MIRKLVIAAALAAWLPPLGFAWAAQLETGRLVVQDTTASLDEERLAAFAARVEASLSAVLELWGLDAQVAGRGKIRVLYDEPLRDHCTATFFQPGGPASGKPRFVRVFGCAEAPLMLAHKLTSALMPQPDKLLRNMWGGFSEGRVGDPASFPACGQDVDDWVRAAGRAGVRIPLAELGPDHESWGMRDEGNGRLLPFDRQRQQRAYAEAASFAKYLAATYGLDALKRLQRLSHTSGVRPWRAALGADLDELEARWLESLRENAAGREERVGRLVRILNADRGDPCERARRAAGQGLAWERTKEGREMVKEGGDDEHLWKTVENNFRIAVHLLGCFCPGHIRARRGQAEAYCLPRRSTSLHGQPKCRCHLAQTILGKGEV